MNRRHALKALTGLVLCPLCASTAFAAEGAHWTYGGSTGPDKWGDLDAASKVCSVGSQQSPIDIGGSIKAQLPPLRIAWGKTADSIVNNGHTIQVNAAEGSTLSFGGDPYALVQFHFHRPSEHLIRGKSFPMEVHFVHAHASRALAAEGEPPCRAAFWLRTARGWVGTMSALGHKRTSAPQYVVSALLPIATAKADSR